VVRGDPICSSLRKRKSEEVLIGQASGGSQRRSCRTQEESLLRPAAAASCARSCGMDGKHRADEHRGLVVAFGFHTHEVEGALLQLESEGQVLREFPHRRRAGMVRSAAAGANSPAGQSAGCGRNPTVPASEFMKFLFQWQHVAPGTRLHGEEGLARDHRTDWRV
jgi:hypothetical protein